MSVTTIQNLQNALAYVKGVLSITTNDRDNAISYAIKAANATIKRLTNIDLITRDEQTLYYDGAGQRSLYIGAWLTPTAIYYNANQWGTADRQLFETTSYVVNDGVVSFISNLYRGKKNIKVVASATWTEFDNIDSKYDDLKYALALICGNVLATSKQGGIKSESVSGTSLVYDKSVMSSDVMELINLHRYYAV